MIEAPEKPQAALESARGPLRSREDRPLLATAGHARIIVQKKGGVKESRVWVSLWPQNRCLDL
jgi:hypothetical protein